MTSQPQQNPPRARSKIGTRFRNINVALLTLAMGIMILFMLLIIRNITDVVSQDYAQLYSTRVTGILNTHLSSEIALMNKTTRSPQIVEWFADEADEEKRLAAYNEMLGTMQVLESGDFYFGIEASLNEFSIIEGLPYDEFEPYAVLSPTLADDAWYFDCITSERPYLLNVDIDKLTGRKRVWLNYKVEKDGVVVGALCTGLMFDQVLDELFGEYDRQSVRTYVIDEHGAIKMDSALEGEENILIYENTLYIQDSYDDPDFLNTMDRYLAQATEVFTHTQAHEMEIVTLSGTEYSYASIAPIIGANWLVVSFYNASSLFSVSSLWPLFLVIIALYVIYAVAISLMNQRIFLQPIDGLMESLAGRGRERQEGAARIYGADRDDEFGALARTLEETFAQLDDYNAQLVETTARAESASRSKSVFLANMSHEIRTPINAIVGMTHIGRKAANVERKDYCLEKIDGASTLLLSVINDILDISKIEADKFDLSIVWFDLERLFQNVANVFAFRMLEKRITFMVTLDPALPTAVEGDDQRISQVITNLLSNAVKFTPEGGRVDVEATLAQGEGGQYTLRVAVRDTGIGITPEAMGRLFQAFEQAEGGTTRKYGGTGLGLAISKRIVEIMGGQIGVDSTPGEGAEFYFTLTLNGRREARAIHAPLRLLLVDENPDVQRFFAHFAGEYAVACDIVATGQQALALGGGEAYDLCFLADNGAAADLAGALATLWPQAAMVLITDAMRDGEGAEGRAGHALRVITKPLFPAYVFDCIRESQGGAGESDPSDDLAENDCFAGCRILLAEDVDLNREVFCAIVEHTGVAVDCAENGLVALQTFARAPDAYDLIMMDVQMPEMDGYDAVRAIRALAHPHAKTVPIIAMTANVFQEDISECLEAGMNDHIGKPVDYTLLMGKLRQYMAGQGA